MVASCQYLESHSCIRLHHQSDIPDQLANAGTNLRCPDANHHRFRGLAHRPGTTLANILGSYMGALLDTLLGHFGTIDLWKRSRAELFVRQKRLSEIGRINVSASPFNFKVLLDCLVSITKRGPPTLLQME